MDVPLPPRILFPFIIPSHRWLADYRVDIYVKFESRFDCDNFLYFSCNLKSLPFLFIEIDRIAHRASLTHDVLDVRTHMDINKSCWWTLCRNHSRLYRHIHWDDEWESDVAWTDAIEQRSNAIFNNFQSNFKFVRLRYVVLHGWMVAWWWWWWRR